MESIAVVTGASRGIGRAVAEAFAEAGHVVWALARTEEALQSLAEAHPGRVKPLLLDASNANSVVAAAKAVLQGGAPRVLVNNAGIALSAPLKRTSTEDYRRVMAVNVEAPFLLCRELMPAMADAGFGRVINVASTAALKGFTYTSAYCASKHALLGLTRALALEYARKHVTVNAVCPGWTDTDMLQRSVDTIVEATGRTAEQARAQLAGMNAMGTLIRPRDVAALCLFLASDAASAVTGAAYTMDGGEAV
ncbi:MAG: SDR family oxidoreductase [Deltaproteobacteria bacterium]|nr:SDR family oxidoreductase [Deltaproteobacteria bacterium]